jgi:hypothetical protein
MVVVPGKRLDNPSSYMVRMPSSRARLFDLAHVGMLHDQAAQRSVMTRNSMMVVRPR